MGAPAAASPALSSAATFDNPTAGDAQQAALQHIIPMVRERIEVPTHLDNFTSDSWMDHLGNMYYNLRWHDGNWSESIEVSVTAEGVIHNVWIWTRNRTVTLRPRFPQLNREEALEQSIYWLKRLAPELVERVDLTAAPTFHSHSGYNVTFQHYINGIPVQGDVVSIAIDGDTGELRSMWRSWATLAYRHVDAPEELLTPEEASNAVFATLGLELQYRYAFVPWSPGAEETPPTVVLEYSWPAAPSWMIDARTGEFFILPSEDWFARDMGGGRGAGGDGLAAEAGMFSFTPQELARIEEVGDLISVDDALALLQSFPQLAFHENFNLTWLEYSVDRWQDFRNILNMSFNYWSDEGHSRWAGANIDAITSELLSFHASSSTEHWQTSVDEKRVAELQQIAEEFLALVAPSFYQETQLDTNPFHWSRSSWRSSEFFSFQRVVNGIPFAPNSLQVQVGIEDGLVTSYSRNWQEGLTFPAPRNLLGEEAAFAAIAATGIEPVLMYVNVPLFDGNDAATRGIIGYEAKLVYLINTLTNHTVDAFAGTVYWFGQPLNEIQPWVAVEVFVDLVDHPHAREIQEVWRHLNIPGSDYFHPDQRMTQEDLLRWLFAMFFGYYDSSSTEDFYQLLRSMGIWEDRFTNPSMGLNALQAAEYFGRFLNMPQYLDLPLIFQNPFNLRSDLAVLVALAAGSGVIDLATFQPGTPLSRADAMMMLYSYLSRE